MYQTFIDTLNRLKITRDQLIIIALSGGADSVALLHLFNLAGYKCIAAHCNFHLRKEESDRDEQFVKDLCASLNIRLLIKHFDTVAYASAHKVSIEMAARDQRYSWFEEIRTEYNASYIAVAHHADDQIETLFLNLLRGTGIRGMSGMKEINGFILRPILNIYRTDLEEWLSSSDYHFIHDSSNFTLDYKRNKIRHQLIPLLEEIQPNSKATILRSMSNMAESEELYKQALDQIRQEIVIEESSDKMRIDLLKLQTKHPVKTILYDLLSSYNFNRITIEQLIKSLDTAQSGQMFYSSTHRLIKNRDTLLIHSTENKSESDAEYFIQSDDTGLQTPVCFKVDKINYEDLSEIEKAKHIAYFDYDKLSFPLKLRKWRTGDRMKPFGMRGSRKISDIFSDMKYDIYRKENTWLLCNGDDIIWLIGEKTHDSYKVTNQTKTVYRILLENNNYICTR
ncbi:MAG: tRNA lysidine(34) synthetase TilS [Bacteroidales bacterium]